MCLAVPGKILEIDGATEPRMGTASFGGIRKQVCLAWVPDAAIGDYVIVHVGFAISRMDEGEAKTTLSLYQQMADIQNAATDRSGDRSVSVPVEGSTDNGEGWAADALR